VTTEFHTEHGPVTLVPLPSRRSSLVCVLDPPGAAALFAMTDAELAIAIERRAHSLLGKVSIEPGRGLFPLAVETARTLARARIALVGEAAHVVPPIGAQGLNLGLRDAAHLIEAAVETKRAGGDVGGGVTLTRYEASRRGDVLLRAGAVNALNRSLIADFAPLDFLRSAGLAALSAIGPLRRFAMREGISPQNAPRAMRR
jgi:2-octaprenyl-6-methoxyphenol hydroxylase